VYTVAEATTSLFAPRCPWHALAPANLSFCEADVCGWITQPANTWTNVGFLVAGAYILRAARRTPSGMAAWLGPIALLTAFTSSALHATSTFAGQAMDQSSMFLESSLFVAISVKRWRGWSPAPLAALYAGLVVVSTALLLWLETVGIALFVAQVVTFGAIELRLWFRERERTRYRALAAACATFAVSYALWWLDELRIVCDPNNHVFTLHGAWHLLGALSFPLWFRHFAQFASRAGRGPREGAVAVTA
jgi:hypothetical protein